VGTEHPDKTVSFIVIPILLARARAGLIFSLIFALSRIFSILFIIIILELLVRRRQKGIRKGRARRQGAFSPY